MEEGMVLVCKWRRCWLEKRPETGDCGECSQRVVLWVGALRGYHRVVGRSLGFVQDDEGRGTVVGEIGG